MIGIIAKSASRDWSGTFRWPRNIRYNRLDDQEHCVKNTWGSIDRSNNWSSVECRIRGGTHEPT
jgi:hypothetical protein